MNKSTLIQECKQSNPQAQRELINSYSALLYNVALRYAVDREDAKDIIQEAWIKIFNNIKKYKEEGKFEAWLTRIVINTALRKKNSFQSRSHIYVESFFDAPSVEPRALENLKYDDLIKIVNQIPEVSREVFKMAAIDGLRHKEIADILNIKESTSRAHLTRAKQALRSLIVQLEKVKIYEQ
ncbi:MAG: sigma-70 family RNA polymerase sigma factor [Saprospiraceae bacterium]